MSRVVSNGEAEWVLSAEIAAHARSRTQGAEESEAVSLALQLAVSHFRRTEVDSASILTGFAKALGAVLAMEAGPDAGQTLALLGPVVAEHHLLGCAALDAQGPVGRA